MSGGEGQAGRSKLCEQARGFNFGVGIEVHHCRKSHLELRLHGIFRLHILVVCIFFVLATPVVGVAFSVSFSRVGFSLP